VKRGLKEKSVYEDSGDGKTRSSHGPTSSGTKRFQRSGMIITARRTKERAQEKVHLLREVHDWSNVRALAWLANEV